MATPSRTIRVYKSYSFVDKDPVIDVMRTVVEDSKKSYAKISRESDVSATTLSNWFYGKTKRPQFCTVAAVARACGLQLTIGGRRVTPLRVIPGGKRKSTK
jgi:DNA-binding phage protein